MAEEYEKAVTKGKSGDDITIFNDLNEDVFEDIMLSIGIEHTTKQGKLHLVCLKNAKWPNIQKGTSS